MIDTNFYKNLFIFRGGIDTQEVIGEDILGQFIDTMSLNTENVDDASLEKCILLMCALQGIEGLPNKLLLITSNDIQVSYESWEKMENQLLGTFQKEFVEKSEFIVWNPTTEKNNVRIGNVYEVFGMNKDLINYLCGKTRTPNKTNAFKQEIMHKVYLPARKPIAAKKSRFNKN